MPGRYWKYQVDNFVKYMKVAREGKHEEPQMPFFGCSFWSLNDFLLQPLQEDHSGGVM